MDSALEAALIESLDALEQGQPLADILARFPDQAAQLRPLLEVGQQLSEMRIAHAVAAQARSRQALLQQAAALQAAPRRSPAGLPIWRRVLLSLAGLALVLVVFGTILGTASAGTIPGDALYPVKLALEQARLALVSDPAGREALRDDLAAERNRELAQMLATGRDGQID